MLGVTRASYQQTKTGQQNPEKHPVVLEMDMIQPDQTGVCDDQEKDWKVTKTSRVGPDPQNDVAHNDSRSLKDDTSVRWLVLVVTEQSKAPVINCAGSQKKIRDGIARQDVFKVGKARWVVQRMHRRAVHIIEIPLGNREVPCDSEPVAVYIKVSGPVRRHAKYLDTCQDHQCGNDTPVIASDE